MHQFLEIWKKLSHRDLLVNLVQQLTKKMEGFKNTNVLSPSICLRGRGRSLDSGYFRGKEMGRQRPDL